MYNIKLKFTCTHTISSWGKSLSIVIFAMQALHKQFMKEKTLYAVFALLNLQEGHAWMHT